MGRYVGKIDAGGPGKRKPFIVGIKAALRDPGRVRASRRGASSIIGARHAADDSSDWIQYGARDRLIAFVATSRRARATLSVTCR